MQLNNRNAPNQINGCITRGELAELYNIDPRTLYRWFKKYKIEVPQGRIHPNDLEVIFEKLGKP